jgi:Arc/MetJ family transcription regulator
MRTTVDIDEKLLAEAEKITGEKSPSKAVNAALREMVRRRKIEGLRRLIKETTLEDTWREDEEAEVDTMKKQRL